MAISIDYGNTNIIDVELADLTLVSGSVYNFDTDAFHLTLRDLEDDVIGQAFPTTHRYVASDTIVGVTDFPKMIVLPPYSVRFPDLNISINLTGTNNNIFDIGNGILVKTDALIIPGNSFGNTITSVGSGLSTEQADMLMELWQLMGLDTTEPVTRTSTSVNVDQISQSITGDCESSVTIERT